MSPRKKQLRRIAGIGTIAALGLPEDWLEIPQPPDPLADGWLRRFAAPDKPDISISLYFRGTFLDRKSARFFLEQSAEKRSAPRQLDASEIIDWQHIMGYERAGNNQYSNKRAQGSPGEPCFLLQETTLLDVSGRLVLRACGSFKNGAHYLGIFYSGDREARVIEELMLQTSTEVSLKKHAPLFEEIIASIVWR